jgi:hypothetical protein
MGKRCGYLVWQLSCIFAYSIPKLVSPDGEVGNVSPPAVEFTSHMWQDSIIDPIMWLTALRRKPDYD